MDKYRPCVANGEKALFHRWIKKDQLILKTNVCVKVNRLAEIRKAYDETGVIPVNVESENISVVLALVEFEDGTIKEITPSSVRFLDSGNLFWENSVYFWDE